MNLCGESRRKSFGRAAGWSCSSARNPRRPRVFQVLRRSTSSGAFWRPQTHSSLKPSSLGPISDRLWPPSLPKRRNGISPNIMPCYGSGCSNQTCLGWNTFKTGRDQHPPSLVIEGVLAQATHIVQPSRPRCFRPGYYNGSSELAAVREQQHAVHVVGVCRGQKRRRSGHVLRFPDAARGDQGFVLLHVFGILNERL